MKGTKDDPEVSIRDRLKGDPWDMARLIRGGQRSGMISPVDSPSKQRFLVKLGAGLRLGRLLISSKLGERGVWNFAEMGEVT